MAEAVVEDRPQPPQRFYCHLCSVEVQSVNADFTCPICSGGFIEELPATNVVDQLSDDIEMQDANGMDDLDLIRDEIASLLMARGGGRPPESEIDDDGTNSLNPTNGSNGNSGNSSSITISGSGGRIGGGGAGGVGMIRRNRRRPRVQTLDRFDNVIFEILQTLSGGNEASLGNASMFFMGNPGDYAWGREGIDTIVTQLLNQMDTTGPPPLPKDKIDEIPNVEITQEQVEQKLQCSVCWEDFKIMESVRKLPCLHVYHESCIVPWLELHGTCPICRKSLTPEGSDVSSSLRNAASVFNRNSSDGGEIIGYNLPSGVIGGRLSSSSASSTTTVPTGSNSNSTTSLSSQATATTRPLPLLPDRTNIFSSIPMSFSRIFSQPGGSGTAGPSTSVSLSSSQQIQPPISQNLRPHQSQQTTISSTTIANPQQQQNNSDLTGNDNNRDSRNNSSSQSDVYRFDDGNVEYEFD